MRPHARSHSNDLAPTLTHGIRRYQVHSWNGTFNLHVHCHTEIRTTASYGLEIACEFGTFQQVLRFAGAVDISSRCFNSVRFLVHPMVLVRHPGERGLEIVPDECSHRPIQSRVQRRRGVSAPSLLHIYDDDIVTDSIT